PASQSACKPRIFAGSASMRMRSSRHRRRRGGELLRHVSQGQGRPRSLAIFRLAARFGARNKVIPVIRRTAISTAMSVSICRPRSLHRCLNNFTGIKYHRVTGHDVPKHLYDRAAAGEMARRHAHHFVERCIAELESVPAADWNPIMTVPFDAELFGHWWFEGPIFLEHVILAAAE